MSFFSVEWISVFLSRSLKEFMVDLDHSGIYLAKGLYRCLIRDREDRLLINCSRWNGDLGFVQKLAQKNDGPIQIPELPTVLRARASNKDGPHINFPSQQGCEIRSLAAAYAWKYHVFKIETNEKADFFKPLTSGQDSQRKREFEIIFSSHNFSFVVKKQECNRIL